MIDRYGPWAVIAGGNYAAARKRSGFPATNWSPAPTRR